MNLRRYCSISLAAGLALLTVACTTVPAPVIQREETMPSELVGEKTQTQQAATTNVPRAQIRRGSGQVIDRSAAAAPPPNLPGRTGGAIFNFEGESLHAVVQAILGDMLEQNYVIAPDVQGTVTLATPRQVSPAQAMSLLDMVLGWNNARMVYSDGRYNIVPADQAMAGTVAPRTGSAATARGFEVRAVPLNYISAAEMKRLLEPYARPDAIIAIDANRNLITIGGTRAELQNYLRTIEIFDVDWMSSMSVGVFPLQSGNAGRVVASLEKVFGEQSASPVAGMFRFMPLDGANAVLVITPQAAYLDDIQQWLDRIDSAGDALRLFSYELKYIKAGELADRLAEVFGGGGQTGNAGAGSHRGSLMPGLTPTEIRDSGIDDDGLSSAPIGNAGALGDGQLSLDPVESTGGSVSLEIDGDRVGVSAVDETNTLLVRTTGAAWQSIRNVIERLDVMPLQVHIEAQIAEVKLLGALSYGVSWYFENAVSDPVADGGAGLPDASNRTSWSDIAGSILPANGAGGGGLAWTFLGPNAAAVISALDQVTDVRLLQTPSLLVRNNAEATLNVGSRIPIASVTVNPGTGSGDTSYSQVQYLNTGTILTVRPRVTRDGMVFLDIVQEVSTPGDTTDVNGNVRIDTRRLKTEAAIQSGNTVILAGLIQDGVSRGSSGIPGLSRIPIIGSLFGRRTSSNDRNEVIILLTPTIVRNPLEAHALTDEYGRRFQAMEPLKFK